MLLEKWLMPDRVYAHYYDVTPEAVLSAGRHVLLCDIDNTLATYDDPIPPQPLLRWFAQMEAAGVRIAFVSNNSRERVERFNAALGYPAFGKAGKPKTKYLQAACDALGVSPEEAIALGDQLLTDCAAAKRFGIPAWIVPPIKDKRTLFFRAKRRLEAPYMRSYFRQHGAPMEATKQNGDTV